MGGWGDASQERPTACRFDPNQCFNSLAEVLMNTVVSQEFRWDLIFVLQLHPQPSIRFPALSVAE
jgi:hypothetical protein